MQSDNLKRYLEAKNCTKLICGANNENYNQITNLVAAKKGLEYSNKTDCTICISVGAKNDPHVSKCKINRQLCTNCKTCAKICPQSAIEEDNDIKINEKKCIGCAICKNNCPKGAIERYFSPNLWQENFEDFKNCDCIEFHIMSPDIDEINEKWEFLCSNFDGFLSISVNHSIFSAIDLIEQLKKMLSIRKPYSTIIQADGIPMSGNNDEYRTTLQAVAMADFIERADLKTYIHVSGGTNSKTKELIDKFKININGISIGTYARKVVKDYINEPDFLTNKEKFNKALFIARDIIHSTKS